MRKKRLLSCRPLTALAVCSLVGLSLPLFGQQEETSSGRIGLVEDWSTHHAVFARSGPLPAMLAAQSDPRALNSWRRSVLAAASASGERVAESEIAASDRDRERRRKQLQRDWSIGLGTAGTAGAMYPAIFTADFNTPSCPNDFAVFPVNQAPNSTHENLVAFNNLYSGTVPANGICNRTPSANDNGTSATVMWSYAVSSSIAAGVATSPVLSLDGTKLAFVESKGGQQPHFHVLAWKSGDGVPANLQNTQLPKVLSTFTASAPVAGSGTATDLPFGASSAGPGDTLSSPFVDYTHDTAYVGDDKGKLVRIQDVFCVIDVFGIVVMNPDCIPAPPAPSIDTAWGGTGTVAVACAAKLTGPVVDFLTGNVFVGCADGKLYGFNSSGTALANSPVTVGDGTTFGGIVDPPIVDSTNGFVYAVAGSGPGSGTGSGGSHAVLVQTKTDLSSARTATLGKAGVANLHTGTFNDAYFSSSTSTDWLIYVQGYNGGGTQTFLYGVGFDASRNLNTGTPGNTLNIHSTTVECSPLTEFLNSGTDRLFLSLLGGANTLDDFNINSFPTTGASATAVETGGTSGIIVDNVSTANQASSIYFTTLGGHAAVKLSQSALQ